MDAGSSTCQIYPLHLGPHWIMLLFTPLTRSPSSPFHCFLCLTDVRHAVTGSAPEMLRREETQGSRGSLSYHRRYKRRLADAPEEKPVLVYTWGYGRLNKGGVAVGPYTAAYQVCFPHISQLHLTSVAFMQAKTRFWLVLFYAPALSYREMGSIWIPVHRKHQIMAYVIQNVSQLKRQ